MSSISTLTGRLGPLARVVPKGSPWLHPTRRVRRPDTSVASSAFDTRLHEGLVEVFRIRLDGRAVAGVLAPDGDALGLELVRVELEHTVEQLGQAHELEGEAGGPRELEQPLDDGVDALELVRHHALEPLAEALVVELAGHEPREGAERRERVLDLVGEAGGQGAEGGETVGAPELLLELAQHGDVAEHADHAEVLALATAEGRGAHLDRQRACRSGAGGSARRWAGRCGSSSVSIRISPISGLWAKTSEQ